MTSFWRGDVRKHCWNAATWNLSLKNYRDTGTSILFHVSETAPNPVVGVFLCHPTEIVLVRASLRRFNAKKQRTYNLK